MSSSPRKAPRRVGRLASRRLRVLAALLPASAGAATADEVCARAAGLLSEDAELFPFVLVYIWTGGGAELIATGGARPPSVEAGFWPLEHAIETGVPVRVDAPHALAVPIAGRQAEPAAVGVLVTGVADRFARDPDHPTFLQLVAAQLAAALAGVEWARESAALKAEMARTAQLEHLKSDFLRLASHELRGPLAVVRGYLDMVNSGTFGGIPEGLKDVLPIVTGKIDEMNRLVEQMLETARIDDNRLSLSRHELDLREVLRHSAQAVAPYARTGHSFRFRLSPEPVLVEADRTRISGVITNIIDNAIKYSPAGGQILLECGAGEVAGTAAIRVTDHGLGIAEDDLPRLFTRFGRIVTPENSHISGTGLGLYLAREITRMHGGDIRLDSTVGSGTTVEITLPLASRGRGTAVSAAGAATSR